MEEMAHLQSGVPRRPYEPPAIVEELELETTAIASCSCTGSNPSCASSGGRFQTGSLQTP
jgi:hypothetical protein